jgi:hypothetical protein
LTHHGAGPFRSGSPSDESDITSEFTEVTRFFSSFVTVTVNGCDNAPRAAARHRETADGDRGSGPRSAGDFVLVLGHTLRRADRRVRQARRRRTRHDSPDSIFRGSDVGARRRLGKEARRRPERFRRLLASAALGRDDAQRHLREGVRRVRRPPGREALRKEKGRRRQRPFRFSTAAALPTGPRRIGPPVAADRSDVEARSAVDLSPVF